MILNWGEMLTPGHAWQHLETFWLSQLMGCYSHLGVEAMDAAEHPAMHRVAPYNEELSGPSSAMIENPALNSPVV